jgi:hypothetical protein
LHVYITHPYVFLVFAGGFRVWIAVDARTSNIAVATATKRLESSISTRGSLVEAESLSQKSASVSFHCCKITNEPLATLNITKTE